MSALTDLQAAVGKLTQSISDALGRIAATAGTPDADIETVVGQINALKTQVDSIDPAAPAPVTPPAPTPPTP